jgi:superfamily II DNA/RNA helicase
LVQRGILATALHGDLSQDERNKAMEKFRRGSTRYLVATNVAARGLDVQGLPLVVNFGVPEDTESYTHRCGRTGRAGAQGMAWTLVTPRSVRSFEFMMRRLNLKPIKWDIPGSASILKKAVERAVEDALRSLPPSAEVETALDGEERADTVEKSTSSDTAEASGFHKAVARALKRLTENEKNHLLGSLLQKQINTLEAFDVEAFVPTRPVVMLNKAFERPAFGGKEKPDSSWGGKPRKFGKPNREGKDGFSRGGAVAGGTGAPGGTGGAGSQRPVGRTVNTGKPSFPKKNSVPGVGLGNGIVKPNSRPVAAASSKANRDDSKRSF